jgi:hypothetical protein
MQKRKLGKSNLEVSAMGLGCMRLSPGQSEAQPKLVTKHRHGMSLVAVVATGGRRHPMTGMWVGRLSVDLMCNVAHFQLRWHRRQLAFASCLKTS